MPIFTRALRTAFAGACALSLTAPAGAAYFPRADGNAVRSLSHGLGVQSLPVLQRRPRANAEKELQSLSASLPGAYGPAVAREKRSDRLRVQGQTWQIDVIGDGSGAQFVNRAAVGREHALRVAPSRAPSAVQLEVAGRAFISRYLSKVIVLQRGERLVPEAASARTETGVRSDGTGRTDAVVANRVVFTREINGIPVVGAGSKVTVTFLNDGSVESFRYDWPAYVPTGRVQSVAASTAIVQRLQRVMSVRAQTGPMRSLVMPHSASAVNPLQIAGNTQLERLACGYYDPGYMNRAAEAPVQAGCYYHVLHYRGEGSFITAAGYSGAVPAANRDEADQYWPEAALLHNMQKRGYPAPASAAPGTKTQPVPSKRR